MPAFVPRRYEQILQTMINKVVSRTALSDITDASVVKHVLAASARELDEVYFQMTNLQSVFSIDTAEGDDLDARAREVLPGVLTRNQATKSTGFVTFSRQGTTGTVNIPQGTRVKTGDGIEFETTATGTIADGFTSSGDVAAVAVVAGAAGNVAAGTVIKFDAKPPGVDAVTNNANFVFGEDKESDADFRNRIRDFIATLPRSTVRALEFAAEQVSISTGQRVRFAHAFEDPVNRGEVVLYIDDGAGTTETEAAVTGENVTLGLAGPPPDSAVGGEEFLYLDNKPVKTTQPFTLTSSSRGVLVQGTDYTLEDASGQIKFTPALTTGEVITADYTHYTGLIQETQKVIDGDPADRETYPGWRAAGVRVRVRSPAILVQDVTAVVAVAEGYSSATVFTDVTNAVLDYVNNLGISGDVLVAKLIEVMMAVPGVHNVSLTEPTSDVVILDDQLPRISSSNVTLS